SSDVAIRWSHFTQCGEDQTCIWPLGADVRINNNTFVHTPDADMIRGATQGVTIRHNVFNDDRRGSCQDEGTLPQGGSSTCNHNDMIQTMGGGPWTIVDNIFGDRDSGTGQIYVATTFTNGVHDVSIDANTLCGSSVTSTGLYGLVLAGGWGDGGGARP